MITCLTVKAHSRPTWYNRTTESIYHQSVTQSIIKNRYTTRYINPFEYLDWNIPTSGYFSDFTIPLPEVASVFPGNQVSLPLIEVNSSGMLSEQLQQWSQLLSNMTLAHETHLDILVQPIIPLNSIVASGVAFANNGDSYE